MTSYDEWNNAIATWFTAGQPHDTRIFMSVDSQVIEAIGRTLGVKTDAVGDFRQAVATEVVYGDAIDATRISRDRKKGAPRCVAFLAACVLAASNMQNLEEKGIRDTNFFSQLRRVLGLFDIKGRPDGLDPATDDLFWNQWARYLNQNGLHSTARRGVGAREFVDLPISQTLLRETDKERLCRLFESLALGRDLDPVSLVNRLSSADLHHRVAEAFEDERREALIDAIHDLYENWTQVREQGGAADAKKLYAGLYRTVDFLGNASWLIYPREPRRQHRVLTEATRDGERFALSLHRPGFLCPIAEVSVRDLDEGTRFEIEGGGSIVLPRRDYWVLVRDPENREENVFASWGAPDLGAPFVILARKEKLDTFRRLRLDGLIHYDTETMAFDDDTWWVLEDCAVLSERATRDFKSLYGITELSPRSRVSISVSGGIHAPGGGEWMAEHGPTVVIVTFEEKADVTVTRPDDGVTLHAGPLPTGERIPIDFDEQGRYRVEVRVGDKIATRDIVIVDWAELATLPPLSPPVRRIEGSSLCGARVEPVAEGERA